MDNIEQSIELVRHSRFNNHVNWRAIVNHKVIAHGQAETDKDGICCASDAFVAAGHPSFNPHGLDSRWHFINHKVISTIDF